MIKNRNFTLVLSGGGALGIAHLGVLADLEKNAITPKEIVGTSIGSIIGACFAIGMREKEIYKRIEDFSAVYKWISFSFSGNAIVESDKEYRSILSKIGGYVVDPGKGGENPSLGLRG